MERHPIPMDGVLIWLGAIQHHPQTSPTHLCLFFGNGKIHLKFMLSLGTLNSQK
jgi:hypothetical protein